MVAAAATIDAYKLMHEGAIAFAHMERAGMRVDLDYLHWAVGEVAGEIKALEDRLRGMEEYKLQQRRYGASTNVGSRDQLAVVLFKDLGHKPSGHTAGGKPSMDDAALEKIGSEYTSAFLSLMKLGKLHGTYLKAVLRECEGEYLHPIFDLHTTVTYRSSSSNPNFQNIPIRDPEYARWIRRAFVPRPGHVLVEIDIVQAEVRVAACYHKDPTMLRYIRENYDFHKQAAADCFKLPLGEVPKQVRQCAKGGFVFAEFYGDYYVNVARHLWEEAAKYNLTTQDGLGLHQWLAQHGVERLGACEPKTRPRPGTFEHHIQQVEEKFWNKTFPVYNQWRRDWYDQYTRTGGFDTLTGFHVRGSYTRNEVINSPVQGSAFHCLLWSLIRIIKWLVRHKLRTVVVGQIHDSIVLDVYEPELPDVLAQVKHTMTEALPAAWPWIIVPFEIEAEASSTTWWDKQEIQI